ncbi:MAG: sugar phosphate isomerase/epimerase family protein [Candidatus Methylomirabilales bacterium]
MRPALLFCHSAFGKDLTAIRRYRTARAYDGVEWAWDGWRLMLPRERRRRHLDALRDIAPLSSAHAPYADMEIGHPDAAHARAATQILTGYIEAAADLGAHHLNLHAGSYAPAPEEFSRDNCLRSLSVLMERAARLGTAVTLENLRQGPTSDPETFTGILRATGIPVTFDLGHAHGSAWVQAGHGSVADVLRAIPTRVLAAHIYFSELRDAHVVPSAVADIAEALDGLRAAGCDFWVLELHAPEPLEQTRKVVDEYLARHSGRAPGAP